MADKPIFFEGIGRCFYRLGEFRNPRKNEFYLSGAVVQGWRAPNDLGSPYRIAVPTHYASTTQAFVRGEAVRMTPGGIPLPRPSAELRAAAEAQE